MTGAPNAYVHVTVLETNTSVSTSATKAIPTLFLAEVDDPEQPYSMQLKVRTVAGRKPEVIELVLEARGSAHTDRITTEGLRGVQIAKALDIAIARALQDAEFPNGSDAPLPRPQRGVAISDAFLEQVATIYRSAVASGSRRPVNDVAERLGASRSTAGRWVVQARRAKILRPAMSTRAGEATPTRASRSQKN